MISQLDLVTELRAVRDRVVHIRPPLGDKPHAFHEDKSDAIRRIDLLLDRVEGNAPRVAPKLTSAEIRHAGR